LCREASTADSGRHRIDFEATIAPGAVGRPSPFQLVLRNVPNAPAWLARPVLAYCNPGWTATSRARPPVAWTGSPCSTESSRTAAVPVAHRRATAVIGDHVRRLRAPRAPRGRLSLGTTTKRLAPEDAALSLRLAEASANPSLADTLELVHGDSASRAEPVRSFCL
jgi:hypothetical protein